MTTNDKQPTGWVVVCFEDSDLAVYDGRSFFGADDDAQTWRKVNPYQCEDYAEAIRTGTEEVHPWPLPAAVLARLKERHPGQDWSQVPVAEEPAEKPGRWVLEDGCSIEPYRDQCGWRQSASDCAMPWSTRAEIEEFMRSKGWNQSSVRPVNLDDLPSPAAPEPSEVEKLRAEVERLTRERDDARASLESVTKHLRKEADEAIRERDEARAELAKARLSRLDEFAKAALTGILAQDTDGRLNTKETAEEAVKLAQATIRAIDGAGGA